MKKKIELREFYLSWIKKLWLMARLCLLLVLFATVSVTASVYSQNTKLTLRMKNSKISDVFNSIEEQTGYYFFYNRDFFDDSQLINVDAEGQNIKDILGQILAEQGASYRIVDRNILIEVNPDGSRDNLNQQQKEIKGTVTDAEGRPLPGVTILIKGTTNGVVSDFEGNYSISDVSVGTVLVFSFVGMRTQEIPVGNQFVIDVSMIEDAIGLQEVVAIGYGTQKKVNLTGAVEQVSSEVLTNRPVNNLTQALQGVVPNLNISLADGKPMRSANYQVRGASSIGQGGNALILIDGVEGDPSLLNPNDIENISVLKDAASASIYGARGTFGVILISTKAPEKGKISVNYTMNYGIKSPTAVPDFVTDGYTYAKWFSEAYNAYNDYSRIPSSMNKTQAFSLAYLEELKRRSENPDLPDYEIDSNGNYVYYGSTDWYGLLYKDNLTSVDQNISISGSNEKVSYYISGRYNDQEGLFRYNSDDYSIYNFRGKGDIKIADWLTLDNNTEYSQQKYHQPLNVGEGGGIWRNIADEGHPTSPMLNPDGTLTHSGAYTVGDMYYGKNGEDTKRTYVKNTTGLTAYLFKRNLRVRGDFTFSTNNQLNHRRRIQVPYSRQEGVVNYVGTTTNDIRQISSETKYLASNIYAEYEKTFNQEHYLKVMTGFNYEESTYESFRAQRNGILFEDAENIALTIGENISTDGSYNKWRIAGQFYRLNYSFKDKYLIELNGRLDGSSKFPSDQQTAFFPSVSVGYRLSNESFWNVNEDLVSNLKLRASYGALGNGNVSPYSYIELFNISQLGRVLNGTRPASTSQPNVIPEGLTWETATTTNFGLDLGLFSNQLNITADIYERKTTDMYTSGLPVPAVFGASVPKGNYADMKTNGWELSISWRDKFNLASKPFNYDVRFTLADNKSVITKFNNPEKLLSDYYEGMELGEIWGFVTDGLFQSEEEILAHADQSYIRVSSNNVLLPGDIKFQDLNNDGKINIGQNRISDPGDLKVIGNSTPRYTFGLNMGGDWNNLFFSCFFQGVGKQDWWPDAEASHFWGQYNRPYNNMPEWHLDNIWSEDRPNAFLPRYRGYVAGWSRELNQKQSRYIMNVAYVRLKNVQLGYNLPQNLMNQISFLSNVKVYLSGENLWSWSPLYRTTKDFDVENIGGSDPELTSGSGRRSGNVLNYPMLKTVSFGVSATF
ncbi:TonB-linked outer membrane protein, SusC/RagA family [Sunxiuqinia elliptica]|uniref:TonB-linked outer membrane protein, SusC/RagA family n=2 Tax=Sunxiuqinia elliptica TaxID=655355 RepID=A0A1I2KR41_9BACT|nr:TonB-linked outer membrane protein, SusC/RagA family [Sunxiuqinia elliptica]